MTNREEIIRLLDYDEKIYDSTTYRKKLIKNINKKIEYLVPKTENVTDDLSDIPTEYKDFVKSTLSQDDLSYYFYDRYLQKPNIYIEICYNNIQQASLEVFLSTVRSADKFIQDAENLFYLIPIFICSKRLICKAYYINTPEKNNVERIFIGLNINQEIDNRVIKSYLTDFYRSILKNIHKENVYNSIDNCASDFVNFSSVWRIVENYMDSI